MSPTFAAPPPAMPGRRYDLDFLRVAAFGLLILYHVGMVYVTWDFHVKSRHASAAIEPFMLLLNPWRLTLLFIISGAATRFMAEHMPLGALARSRSARLMIPVIFGMLVIVPPQSWAQVQESFGYQGSFWSFWPIYLTGGRPQWSIVMPTYNHLWFVIYLWLYTMAAALAWRALPWLERAAARALAGPGLWIWPIAVPLALRLTLYPVFGETHVFFNDVWAHAHYLFSFLLGLAIARNDATWESLERRRLPALIAAGVAFAGFLAVRGLGGHALALDAAEAGLRETFAWLMIAALFGFARRYVTRGGPVLAMLTEAVFPFYIIHQTAIVLVAHALRDRGLPVAAEASILVAATVTSCWAAYLVARAIPWLRLPMGLKPAARKAQRPLAVIASVASAEP